MKALSGVARAAPRERGQPHWVATTLATLTDHHRSDPAWLYELKFDGVRCLTFRKGERVRLLSRNRKDQTAIYPELVEATAAQPCEDFIADGEIVALDDGVSSFTRLQGRMQLQDPERRDAAASRSSTTCSTSCLIRPSARSLIGSRCRVPACALRT